MIWAPEGSFFSHDLQSEALSVSNYLWFPLGGEECFCGNKTKMLLCVGNNDCLPVICADFGIDKQKSNLKETAFLQYFLQENQSTGNTGNVAKLNLH